MIKAIINANPNSEFIYVVDTRPKVRLAEENVRSVYFVLNRSTVTAVFFFPPK